MPPRRRYQKKKQAKSTRARKQMKKTSPALYRAVKAVAKNEALKLQETKYVTSDMAATKVYNTFVTKFNGIGLPTNLNYLQLGIPSMTQGFNSNKLQGAKASIVNCFTTFSINLIASTIASVDIYVRFYLLESKNVKNYSVAAPTSGGGGLQAGNLLRVGNGTETDWFVASGVDPRMNAQRPLNKLAWTGTMKTFRLSKNAGIINGDTTVNSVNLSAHTNAYHFTHNWGHKGKVLTYDDDDGSNYPENFLPIWGVVAWTLDGASTGASYSPMPVEVVAVNHLYYKDA